MARRKKTEDEKYLKEGNWRIPRKDFELFENMKDQYYSEAEQKFFEEMRYRETHFECYAVLGDLLVFEDENPERVRLQRDYDCEFWVLSWNPMKNEWQGTNQHYYSLAEVLQDPVGDTGITLWECLRATDYKYVNYERNYGR